MTNQEAVDIIKTAIAQVEWDYPMDYAAAFDKAIDALQKENREAVPLDALCEWMARQDFRVNGEPIVAKMSAETWRNVIRQCVMQEAAEHENGCNH